MILTFQKKKYSFKPRFVPLFFFLAALAILLSLSTWQFKRLVWKTNLIEYRVKKFESAPIFLEDLKNPKENEFQKVIVNGELLNQLEMHMPHLSKRGNNGYHILVPLKSKSEKAIIFDSGWVPLNKKDIKTRKENIILGKNEFEATIRMPGKKGYFTPENDELKNIWFYVEPSKMEKFTGLNLEKDYYLQTTKSGTNGVPKANQTKVYLRNNHLGYAITWLMIAFGLVGVFFFANVQEIKK